ncbi:MAG: MOSC domain-containing protein [Leadbetterella sp.]
MNSSKESNNMQLVVSQLYIFPIKSMGGVKVDSAEVTDRGFKNDRRWMIVDANNKFISLREFPKMARMIVTVIDTGIRINDLEKGNHLDIPFIDESQDQELVMIWKAGVQAIKYPNDVNQWISEALGTPCSLVYQPEQSIRIVDTDTGYKPEGKIVSFADAYPFLVLSEESVQDLNTRLTKPVDILRFRANIVVSGGNPYNEDEFENFNINGVSFTGLENCPRCAVPNVDPETGTLGADKEPLKTLSKYRLKNKNIEFGRNTVHSGKGVICVGDVLHF